MENILGVILSAFLLTLLPEKLRAFSDYRILFYSVVVITFSDHSAAGFVSAATAPLWRRPMKRSVVLAARGELVRSQRIPSEADP